MNIDANLVAALAAVAAALVAVVAVIVQIRLALFTAGIDNLWRLSDQWDGPPMTAKRAIVATSLLMNVEPDEIVDVLGFFELLGYLVRKRGVDSEAAWSFFSDQAIPYWLASQMSITKDRQTDKTYWVDFEWLFDLMIGIELRKRGMTRQQILPSSAALQDFLHEEERLGPGVHGHGPRAWRRRGQPP